MDTAPWDDHVEYLAARLDKRADFRVLIETPGHVLERAIEHVIAIQEGLTLTQVQAAVYCARDARGAVR